MQVTSMTELLAANRALMLQRGAAPEPTGKADYTLVRFQAPRSETYKFNCLDGRVVQVRTSVPEDRNALVDCICAVDDKGMGSLRKLLEGMPTSFRGEYLGRFEYNSEAKHAAEAMLGLTRTTTAEIVPISGRGLKLARA